MNKLTLPLDTVRIPLLIARIARDYAASPDAGLSFGPRKLVVADENTWAAHHGVHVFHFGVYGDCNVLAFGRLEDALEDAAAALPAGYFTEPDYETARDELLKDGTLTAEQHADHDSDETNYVVHEHATQDLTYTESGYIASWEWTATTFHSLEEVRAFAANK